MTREGHRIVGGAVCWWLTELAFVNHLQFRRTDMPRNVVTWRKSETLHKTPACDGALWCS